MVRKRALAPTESPPGAPAGEGAAECVVCIGDDRLVATSETPLVVGRADVLRRPIVEESPAEPRATRAIIGLDPQDMGISARALTIEFHGGVWWLANLSSKRNLLLDPGYGSAMITLRPGQRHAIAVSPLGVLVPGAIFTHRLDVQVPVEGLALRRPSELGASGTMAAEELHLTESDRRALTAVFAPLLRAWPRRGAHPLSYQEAADLLGAGWTATSVRKHVERVRQRMADSGTFLSGSHAKDDLGQYLLDNGILTTDDLASVDRAG